MAPEAIIENRRFQKILDKICEEEGYDFTTIAFYESNKPSSPVKQHYVSGNKDNRFKLITSRKGYGLAGTVMKTGKRVVTANVGLALEPEEEIDCPTLLSGSLTVVSAVPLWYKNQVHGVLLFGRRDGRPLPEAFDDDDIQRKSDIFNDDKRRDESGRKS